MALAITNPTTNPFNFFFTEPATGVLPDPKNFALEVDFTATNHTPTAADYSAFLEGLTTNFGNTDRFGHNLATIDIADPDFTSVGLAALIHEGSDFGSGWRRREGGRGSARRVFHRGVGWNLMNALERRSGFAGA